MEFELQGELIFKDYFQAALFMGRKQILLEIITVIIVVFLVSPAGSIPPIYRLAFFIFFPIFGALLVVFLIWMREKKNYSSLSKRFHDKVIQIDEEGVRYGSPDSAATFRWSDIKRVDFPKGLILLYISTNQALVIPSRFFQSAQEHQACSSFIRKSLSLVRRGMK